MSIEEVLFEYLSTSASLTALLGAGSDARIYPKRLPQQPVLPALVFQVVSKVPAYTHEQAGDPPVASAFVRSRFQFDLWAADYEGLLPLRDALFAGISGFRGMMGAMKIESVFVLNEVDGFEADTGSARKIVDAVVSWNET